ncbi:Bestrophin, RFP-TM, chloride channel-domain-containing protein [Kalaharituber pfeilii]|nr:Bestrophin, RFP-TM, chloride channel-domain-containing protein [Kalaharituber pfeilii]
MSPTITPRTSPAETQVGIVTPSNEVEPKGDHVFLDFGPVETIKPRTRTGVTIDDYFAGPCDPTRHSTLPWFLRLHGSILPKMIIPLCCIGGWSTAITCISKYVHDLSVDSVLLTVLGFVVGLSLSFGSSTAYERYAEGRRFWAQMILYSRNLGRSIWLHVNERTGEQGKEDVINKLSAVNLIIAYAQAVKHKLRYEPEYDYADLKPYIDHLDTYAKDAHNGDVPARMHIDVAKKGFDTWAKYLGVPFFETNPKQALKPCAKAGIHHGNLPLEIMNYISSYTYAVIENGTMPASVIQCQVYSCLTGMLESFGGCERVLQTPLPIAYNIAISQITWLYVMALPFQLFPRLGWVTIPGTIVAAYIILGIAAIGREIENPFGLDVNDLDMDGYVSELANDLIIMTSRPPTNPVEMFARARNMPLYPYSIDGCSYWKERPLEAIRNAARGRVERQHVSINMKNADQQRVES